MMGFPSTIVNYWFGQRITYMKIIRFMVISLRQQALWRNFNDQYAIGNSIRVKYTYNKIIFWHEKICVVDKNIREIQRRDIW